MSSILEALRDYPIRRFSAGEVVLERGTSTGMLFFLIEGEVEIVKDGVVVATEVEPGAIFGDLSALLNEPHTATVRALRSSAFHTVTEPKAFLERTPQACMHLCELLARRLDAVNKYLVDVKQQFAGHDHLDMVDGVLDTLMNRQPRKRVRPRESTIRSSEVTD
jgi:CRP/FNR family transcriptional regulator, cyclic AMP receptor protein